MASGGTIATRYIQIVPSADGIKGSLTSLFGGEADAAGDETGQKLGSKIVSGIKKIVVAAGIGKMVSESLLAGADVQQSFGGLETIYGKAADAAKKHAKEASQYGISMNTYAEQAVGMGASLRQAFGGDMAKAAKSADMAIKDMADNAAKMGTDVADLQNAYAGFAKQNYTMLDNLKLGYGGTKQEMERLLSDAEKLSGVKYDINNLGDVYDAIHVIQQDLSITGVAAQEAATTFSGSFDAMKASATNLLAEMSLGGDVVGSLRTLGQSVVTFVNGNLMPMLGNVFRSIPSMLGVVFNEFAPTLLQNGISMINNLASGVQQAIPQFLEKALPMLESFSGRLREGAGKLIDAGLALIQNIAKGLADSLPVLISHVPTIITNIAGIINDNMPKILATGVKVVVTLAKGLIKAIPSIISNMPKIINAIVNVITAFNWINLGKLIITGIKNGLTAMVGALKSAAKSGVDAVKNGFKNVSWTSIGKAIIDGIKNGLKNAAGALMSAAKSIASSVLSAAKSALGIHSPSRLFRDQVGKNITLGMAEGIEAEAASMENAISSLSNRSINAVGNIEMTGTRGSSDVYSLLAEWLPQLANTQIVLDDGTVVGGLIDKIDTELGRRSAVRLRGAY